MPNLQGLVEFAVFAVVAWVLPTAFLVFIVYALVRFFTRPSTRRSDADDPLAILKERYARGEIDDEEYARRRNVLTG